MSEHILRILLSELTTLRITCADSKTSVEMSLNKVEATDKPVKCPGCQGELRKGQGFADGKLDVFSELARAIRIISQQRGAVEFILPQESPK